MKLPSLLRCGARTDKYRCDGFRYHGHRHHSRQGSASCHWSTESTRLQTYEVDAPWVTWTYLSDDSETRVTGRARLRGTCCICGESEIVRIAIPRFGPVPLPEGGRHSERIAWIEKHSHPGKQDPSDWALPLRNLEAWKGGLPLSVFENVARTSLMETEIEEGGDDGAG